MLRGCFRGLLRRQSVHVFTPHQSTRVFSSHYRHRPLRDLYEEDPEGEEHGKEEDYEYRRTWRDWCYDHRTTLIRLGIVTTGVGGYYWYHLEAAPITGRRRFINMSPSQEQQLGELGLHEMLAQYRGAVLPSSHSAAKLVEKVARRLIASLDQDNETKWRVFVVDSPTANAFVLPSGDIFVFTGLLPIAKTEGGLAAILAHEIAHKLARHSAEKMSVYQFFNLATSLVQVILMGDFGSPLAGILKELFLFLPFSRKCEEEADHIGLLVMAKACYDPHEAIGVWERMQNMGGVQPPAFLSTHPSHSMRISKIKEWLPKAQEEYESAGCTQSSIFSMYK
ncbi:hypothetical protein PSACC_01314 [Paramicrosporidium saccamoebae]|uniref:Peptidase M48 domain-containing protein n=1 Tax=Paramicrosporidium saccamoebae TaxID=1246581 RepID=A0A2H9TMD1_9FUNG|nr:hypothetical protein PSACC_01314 [Paramicrosporidium saccamoebae]